MRIVLAKDLLERRYDEVAERVSMPTRHLLWFLLDVAEDGRVQEERLRAAIKQAGHNWTEEQLASYLRELASVRCVTFRSNSQIPLLGD
jgi:hypothetical protein